jgi:hypothetical protein
MAQAEHVTTPIPATIAAGIPKSSPNTIRVAHVRLVPALAGHPPSPIPLIPRPVDLEERADHARKVIEAFSDYLISVVEDTAENVSGGLDIKFIKSALSDLSSDVTGIVHKAANDLAEDLP